MASPNVHSPFRLASLDELKQAIAELGLDIAVDDDVSRLARPVRLGEMMLPNAMAVQPMEGCDGTADGAPDELTFRRYGRFAAGGAGVLWFEACAVVAMGRANPRQLWIHSGTRAEFARLVDESRRAAVESMGQGHNPLCVLQLTHSGRYSRPIDVPRPVIAHHDPLLDADRNLPADHPLVTDDELKVLEDEYVKAAALAFEAGFDAVDIKSCHRYLINELLAAHTREGDYGGSYENRTRFLMNIVRRAMEIAPPGRFVTCRLGIHDAHPYPHGWGMDPNDPSKPDLTEPCRLARELYGVGIRLLNITMGNPYFNPHINRPYDRPVEGATFPAEHPLVGVERLTRLTREVAKSVPEMLVIGSGYSWLRNLWPYVAAGSIRDCGMTIAGLGRQSFAYPGFAREIVETGTLERRHTCIACSSCTQIMRDGGRTGCVPFDSEVYGPIYREGRRSSIDWAMSRAARCRDCFDPTCRDGCPAGVDVPGFVTALAAGDVQKSYQILRESNALPELCAYVCPADVQCQARCIEQVFSGDPVPIRELQRFVTSTARRTGWTTIDSQARPSGKRIAVIGAGPAGIACAVRLVELGHSVEVYDASSATGGVAAGTIPAARLPQSAFGDEAAAVLAGAPEGRAAFVHGRALSRERPLARFIEEFDAVFVGIGLGGSAELDGPRPLGAGSALDFLRKAKTGGAVAPARVAVLGGGNTAMDAAVTAVACGAQDVYVLYRRSFAEMPAWPAERDQALAAGVHFLILTAPLGYVAGSDGNLVGVKVARTTLGEPDESGRRRPVIAQGSESVVEVELALEALGQHLPEEVRLALGDLRLTASGLIEVDGQGRTSVPGVFAGGDVVNGGATVVQAVAEGMKAAAAIDEYLSG